MKPSRYEDSIAATVIPFVHSTIGDFTLDDMKLATPQKNAARTLLARFESQGFISIRTVKVEPCTRMRIYSKTSDWDTEHLESATRRFYTRGASDNRYKQLKESDFTGTAFDMSVELGMTDKSIGMTMSEWRKSGLPVRIVGYKRPDSGMGMPAAVYRLERGKNITLAEWKEHCKHNADPFTRPTVADYLKEAARRGVGIAVVNGVKHRISSQWARHG